MHSLQFATQFETHESLLNDHNIGRYKRAFVAMETDQNSSIDLMSISFDLSIGNRVVVQHSLEVGPIGGKMWKQDSFNSLQKKKNRHKHTQATHSLSTKILDIV